MQIRGFRSIGAKLTRGTPFPQIESDGWTSLVVCCQDLPFGFRPPHLKAPQTLELPFQTREVVTLVVAVEVTVDVPLVVAVLVGELVCVDDGLDECVVVAVVV